jgi:hypothetical protein
MLVDLGRLGGSTQAFLVPPEVLKPVRRQRRVDGGAGDRAMADAREAEQHALRHAEAGGDRRRILSICSAFPLRQRSTHRATIW